MNALELAKELDNSDVTLVDFWAEWCGPCKMMKKVLEKVEEDNPRVNVIKINVDEAESKELVNQFGIRNIPTIVVFKRDEEVQRAIGMKQPSQIQEIINEYMP